MRAYNRLARSWAVNLTLLLLGAVSNSANAHNPGLSAAHVTVSDGGLDVVLELSADAATAALSGDGAPILSEQRLKQGLRDASPPLLSLALDDTTLRPLRVTVAGDAQHGFTVRQVFEPVSGARLQVYAPYAERFARGHRRIVTVRGATVTTQSALLSATQSSAAFKLEGGVDTATANGSVFHYIREGMAHIAVGYDHLLFLCVLLLPACGVAVRNKTSWRKSLLAVVGLVSAFTVAHSITLFVAALGFVTAPSALVEPLIALTIVIAAANNVTNFLAWPAWAIAFTLGLIHGLGFAGALADILSDGAPLLEALLGFNIGVELGQLCIVVVAMPVIFVLTRWRYYRSVVVNGGSVLLGLLALVWLVQRV